MTSHPSQQELEAFRAAFMDVTGLRFPENRTPVLAQALRSRTKELKTDVPAYLEGLQSASRELGELARSLTVSETFFLRNLDQFRAVAALIRERQTQGICRLRLLSAGCSTGEEAYSLAMTICETLEQPQTWNIEIIGLDLNPDVVDRARAGLYSAWALRDVPDYLREKYFVRRGNLFAIHDSLKAMVRFESQNLVAPTMALWHCEGFDVIFCRNVLMYFSTEAAQAVVRDFERGLKPGGYLFLGHAEHLRGLSEAFELLHRHDTFYYARKSAGPTHTPLAAARPEERAPLDPPDFVSWSDSIARSADRVAELSLDAEAPRSTTALQSKPSSAPKLDPWDVAIVLMKLERFSEALQAIDRIDPLPLEALLLRATLLLSLGRICDAETACEAILAVEALHAGAYYVLALCSEHEGDLRGAMARSRTASYADSEFAMPHLQRGRLARRIGDPAMARRELISALDLLPYEDPDRIALFGGGFGRETLIQACQSELHACGEQR